MADGEIFYQDSNRNGIPDVFENRLPISEILNGDNDVSASPQASPSFQDSQDTEQSSILSPIITIDNNVVVVRSHKPIAFSSIVELWQFIEDLKSAGRKAFGGSGPVNF